MFNSNCSSFLNPNLPDRILFLKKLNFKLQEKFQTLWKNKLTRSKSLSRQQKKMLFERWDISITPFFSKDGLQYKYIKPFYFNRFKYKIDKLK